MKISLFLTEMQGRAVNLFYVFSGFASAVQIELSNSFKIRVLHTNILNTLQSSEEK